MTVQERLIHQSNKTFRLFLEVEGLESEGYIDWQLTHLYYSCLCAMKAFLLSCGHDLKKNHEGIKNMIDPDHVEKKESVKGFVFVGFSNLHYNSELARYPDNYDETELMMLETKKERLFSSYCNIIRYLIDRGLEFHTFSEYESALKDA